MPQSMSDMRKLLELMESDPNRITLNGFELIVRDWKLSDQEIAELLQTDEATWQDIKTQTGKLVMDEDLEKRMLELTIVHMGLMAMFNGHIPLFWLREPNDIPVFGGKAPLSMMQGASFEELCTVREYLVNNANPAKP